MRGVIQMVEDTLWTAMAYWIDGLGTRKAYGGAQHRIALYSWSW